MPKNIAPMHYLGARMSLWRRFCRHMDKGLGTKEALEAAKAEVDEEIRKLDEEDEQIERDYRELLKKWQS